MASEKQKKLVSVEEEQDIARKMMIWANAFSDDDMPAATINYEFLAADSASMALSTIQARTSRRNTSSAGMRRNINLRSSLALSPATATTSA